ncbi:MFS transporter [Pseudomonas oryzihabitans]|uniref:MFS transporter n=1 Tax=Pseudomonas oryzihabitans TaxID=47885 RepID=UPI0005A992C7|nr:MFS transporter [Pseudomonas oryzihabitans]NMZ44236.1 MFS transporter [Pseudomonas oryzihabitans]
MANASKIKNFNLLWIGQSFSFVGDHIMVVGMPFLGLSVANLNAAQAALLPFFIYLPFLLFGLPAGAIVDWWPKRRVMLYAEISQVVICLFLLYLVIIEALSYSSMAFVCALQGLTNVFFQIAYNSILPELGCTKSELQSMNSKLFFSESLARSAGPASAGLLINFFGIFSLPVANMVSFIISASSIYLMSVVEPIRRPLFNWRGYRDIPDQIRDGVAFVRHHSVLEPIFLCGTLYVVFLTCTNVGLLLYCKEILGMDPFSIGLLVGAAAFGFPIANILSPYILNSLGTGRTLIFSATLSVFGLCALALGGSLGSVPIMLVASVMHGLGEGVFGPAALTARQLVTPANLLGRVNSIQKFLIWGGIAIGSVVASAVVKFFGVEWILWAGGIGTILCLIPLLRKCAFENLEFNQ